MSGKTPEINVIKLSEYKKADPAKKEAPYIIIKDGVERDLYHVGSVDIVGLNTAGVKAILDGAVPPTIDWAKHIYEMNGEQQTDYASVHKMQSELLADLQNVLLEDFIKTNGNPTHPFTSPLLPKYAWAFQQLNKKVADIADTYNAEETASVSSVGSKSVVEEYGKLKKYAEFQPYIEEQAKPVEAQKVEPVAKPEVVETASGASTALSKNASHPPMENVENVENVEIIPGVHASQITDKNSILKIISERINELKKLKEQNPATYLTEEYKKKLDHLKTLGEAHNVFFPEEKIIRTNAEKAAAKKAAVKPATGGVRSRRSNRSKRATSHHVKHTNRVTRKIRKHRK
jgi:hypothetical protein